MLGRCVKKRKRKTERITTETNNKERQHRRENNGRNRQKFKRVCIRGGVEGCKWITKIYEMLRYKMHNEMIRNCVRKFNIRNRHHAQLCRDINLNQLNYVFNLYSTSFGNTNPATSQLHEGSPIWRVSHASRRIQCSCFLFSRLSLVCFVSVDSDCMC